MQLDMTRLLVLGLFWTAIAGAVAAEATGPSKDAPVGLARMAFVLGDWDIHARFGAAANSRTVLAKMSGRWTMGGHAIEMQVEYPPFSDEAPAFFGTLLYTGIPGSERLEMVSTNSLANRKQADEIDHDAGLGPGSISFLQFGELFGGRQGYNRLIFHGISENEFLFQQDTRGGDDVWHVNTFSYRAVRKR